MPRALANAGAPLARWLLLRSAMSSLGLPLNLLLFGLAAAAVWVGGTRITHYADAIAQRKGIDQAFMGFLVLATATQLPEIVTNSTGAMRGDARLVVNSMFGGIGLQTAVLAGADLATRRYPLTFLSNSPSNMLQSAILVLLLSLVLAVSLLGDLELPYTVGLGSVVLALLYLGTVRLLWQFQRHESWRPVDVAAPARADPPARGSQGRGNAARKDARLAKLSLRALVSRTILFALLILAAGVALVRSAESVAELTGLGTSFVGATLLACATSLPELSTTLAAVRLGCHSMAVADVLGSNLIMVALLMPSDLLYRQGLLLDQVDASARFALIMGIVLTALYLVGLLVRQPRRLLRLGFDSWAVLLSYCGGLWALYQLR